MHKGAEHICNEMLRPLHSAKNRYLPLLSRNSHTAIGVIPHLADLVAVTIASGTVYIQGNAENVCRWFFLIKV